MTYDYLTGAIAGASICAWLVELAERRRRFWLVFLLISPVLLTAEQLW